jgi:hypothetical protein
MKSITNVRRLTISRDLGETIMSSILYNQGFMTDIWTAFKEWSKLVVAEFVLKPLSKSVSKSIKAQMAELVDIHEGVIII